MVLGLPPFAEAERFGEGEDEPSVYPTGEPGDQWTWVLPIDVREAQLHNHVHLKTPLNSSAPEHAIKWRTRVQVESASGCEVLGIHKKERALTVMLFLDSVITKNERKLCCLKG